VQRFGDCWRRRVRETRALFAIYCVAAELAAILLVAESKMQALAGPPSSLEGVIRLLATGRSTRETG